MIDIRNLHVHYRTSEGSVHAVRGIDIKVERGQFYTMLGPSGCGKTTTLRCLAGLERPSAGEIRINDQVVYSHDRGVMVPPYKRDIGMVFQSYAIWPHMTVFENAAYPLQVGKARRMPRTEVHKRVMETLELVGLADYAPRPAPQLSGGQQQRLALARALTRSPSLLLLDEPLSNLDAQLREQMRSELKRLQRDTGVTAIYVTHDQAEALAISDRVAVMKDGLVMQLGTPRQIYDRPTSEFVAEFIGRTNLFHGRLDNDAAEGAQVRMETVLGPLLCFCPVATRRGPNVGVVIRPENVLVARAGSAEAAALPEPNRFEGKVLHESYLGEIVEFVIDVRGHEILVRVRTDTPLVPGDTAALAFPVECTLGLIESEALTELADEARAAE